MARIGVFGTDAGGEQQRGRDDRISVVPAKHWHGGSYLGAPPINARQELSRGGWASKPNEPNGVRSSRFEI